MIEAWKIGVSIAMASNATQVLGAIQRDLFGLRREVDMTSEGLGRMKLAAVGAMSAIAGAAVLKGMWGLVDAAKELVHQQTMLRQLGVSNADVAASTASSWAAAGQVLGTNVSRNLELLREAKGAFGTVQEAQSLLPSLAMADVIRSNANGGTSDDRGMQMVMNAIEMRGDVKYNADGTLDHQSTEKGLNGALKFLNASGGQIDESTLKGLITMAGPMAKMMGPDAFYRMMLTVTEELQQKAGTALSAAGRALYGGIMPQRNAVEMERMGLLNAGSVHVRRGGNVSVDQGGLVGFDTLNEQGLPVWVNSVLIPNLHKDYLAQAALHPKMQESQYDQQEMYRLFPTETMRRLVGLYVQQAAGVAKGAKNYDAAQGLDAYRTIMGDATVSDGRRDRDSYGAGDKVQADPTAKMVAFTEAWKNLTTALGVPLVDTANFLMTKMTAAFNDLAQWATKNPETVGMIEKVAAGIALAGIAFGTFAVGSAMIGLISLPRRLAAIAETAMLFGPGGEAATGLAAASVGLLGMVSIIGQVAVAVGVFAAAYKAGDWIQGQIFGDGLVQADPDVAKRRAWNASHPGVPLPDSLLAHPTTGRGRRLKAMGAAPDEPSGAAGDPIHVTVTNTRDIANGVTTRQSNMGARPPAAGSAPDPRVDMPSPVGNYGQ